MRKIVLAFLLCPLLFVQAYAEDIGREAAESMGIYDIQQSLTEDAEEVSGALATDGSYDLGAAMGRLVGKLLESIRRELSGLWASAARIIALTVLSAVAASLCGEKSMQGYISLAACCACSLMLTDDASGIVSLSVDALTQLSDYSKAAIPAVFTAAAATGSVITASARYAAVCVAIEFMLTASQRFIIPLVYAYLALTMADSLIDNSIIRSISKAVKWAATSLMTGITMLFAAYITMTGLITASADAVAVKTTKTVISSVLPVVGGIISDASGVVLSAAAMIKNSAGIFSLIAVCALCVGPFAAISVKLLFFKAAAAVAGMLPDKKLSGLLGDAGAAMALLLGLIGCCSVMMFISFMAAIKVVSPL